MTGVGEIEFVERQHGQQFARTRQQAFLVLDDRLDGERFDGVRVPAMIFHEADTRDDRQPRKLQRGNLADDALVAELLEGGMIRRRPDRLSQADRSHFKDAALDLAREIRMRFDAARNDDRIGARGALIAVHADTAGGRADLDDVHFGLHRRADGFGADA